MEDKQFNALIKKSEHYQRLIENEDFKEFLSDAGQTVFTLQQQILGNWRAPRSGCKTWDEYLTAKSTLHGFIKACNLPEHFINEAKKELDKRKHIE